MILRMQLLKLLIYQFHIQLQYLMISVVSVCHCFQISRQLQEIYNKGIYFKMSNSVERIHVFCAVGLPPPAPLESFS